MTGSPARNAPAASFWLIASLLKSSFNSETNLSATQLRLNSASTSVAASSAPPNTSLSSSSALSNAAASSSSLPTTSSSAPSSSAHATAPPSNPPAPARHAITLTQQQCGTEKNAQTPGRYHVWSPESVDKLLNVLQNEDKFARGLIAVRLTAGEERNSNTTKETLCSELFQRVFPEEKENVDGGRRIKAKLRWLALKYKALKEHSSSIGSGLLLRDMDVNHSDYAKRVSISRQYDWFEKYHEIASKREEPRPAVLTHSGNHGITQTSQNNALEEGQPMGKNVDDDHHISNPGLDTTAASSHKDPSFSRANSSLAAIQPCPGFAATSSPNSLASASDGIQTPSPASRRRAASIAFSDESEANFWRDAQPSDSGTGARKRTCFSPVKNRRQNLIDCFREIMSYSTNKRLEMEKEKTRRLERRLQAQSERAEKRLQFQREMEEKRVQSQREMEEKRVQLQGKTSGSLEESRSAGNNHVLAMMATYMAGSRQPDYRLLTYAMLAMNMAGSQQPDSSLASMLASLASNTAPENGEQATTSSS
ncbi:uncharacterized protein UTRI_10688 [Ustilago trichophora]|uniref:Uncharacterized protein n=1 Tax=Ustilago trichophora TaxID=86804 RepID=A0A5C3EBL0_9BASI|nr:uncharacterized protein UTRI_10688 [Ustilago trichophora]